MIVNDIFNMFFINSEKNTKILYSNIVMYK